LPLRCWLNPDPPWPELGAKFDLRDFNDAVLATGSLPLATLETRMRDRVQSPARR
jgi:uncharacterized protein (DUF885 family)